MLPIFRFEVERITLQFLVEKIDPHGRHLRPRTNLR
jgi:hypothetical protein